MSGAENKTIAKNTVLLYVRMLLIMVVSLYTSRVTLNALGVIDYGIYNVVGGVIATLSFLNTTLSASTSRFITFELGKGNVNKLRSIFANCCSVHLLLSALILLLGETVGLWFVNTQLVIPPERMAAANVVYQCAIGSFIMNVLSVPYNGLIIAHEKMNAFAYISILEAFLKLVCVWALLVIKGDRLIFYAFFWLGISVLIRFIYNTYCIKEFEESRVKPSIDKGSFKSILSFSGYNLCEIFANMMADQGVNILLNLHFGPAINAARGIAVQVNSAMTGFTHNFTTALNPQITKSYAKGDNDRMMSLVGAGGKYSFYLLLLLAVPVFFKVDYILELWLKNPPEYSAEFIRLLILSNLCIMPTGTFYTAISSTGNIKLYQLAFGLFRLTVFPVCWAVLNFVSSSPLSVYVVFVIYEVAGTVLKLILLKKNMEFFLPWSYCRRIIFPCCVVSALIFVANYFVEPCFNEAILPLITFVAISEMVNVAMIALFGLSSEERHLLAGLVKKKLHLNN